MSAVRATIIVFTALSVLLTAGCQRQLGPTTGASAPPGTQVVVLEESRFDSQIQSGIVLVDFWASTCGPCDLQGPIVAQVAERFQGRARVAKLDVDEFPEVALRFNIQCIPTLIVFKDGKPMEQYIGVTTAETLAAALTSAFDSNER